MLFPARRTRLGHLGLLRALLAVSLALAGSSCMWLDDFGKFKIGDAGTVDAQTGQPKADAGPGDLCRDVNCGKMDAECMRGKCDPKTGECQAVRVEDGQSCFDGNPCTSSDKCSAGECVGEAIDCSSWDLECSQGMCDPQSGACVFGPNVMSKSCDDLNSCTSDDRCSASGACEGTRVAAGTKCDDRNPCTGTDARPDQCDDKGSCQRGGNLAVGTACDDDNECTSTDRCNTSGNCNGTPTREGQACQTACTSNTTCQRGECLPPATDAPAYDKRCFQNFCGNASLCQPRWEHDRVCQCGCDASDSADCSDACSARMCVTQGDHKAARWCDKSGKAIDNCPDSLKGDGKCDCGCQFADPDCEGGACCSATGKAGCGNSFVEYCVCDREMLSGDPSCCTEGWTQRCADLAVSLGCATCP